jgi:hypothetical protein
MAEPTKSSDGMTPPATVYETVQLTPEQIEAQNRAFAAMGVNAVVIDISPFCGKLELQSDGTYKRSQVRKPKPKKAEKPNNDEAQGHTG